MGLSRIIIPAYYDYIVEETFFETIMKNHRTDEEASISSDMYAVQRLIIDSKGRVLTRREDIFSLRFLSDDFLTELSESALKQSGIAQRYVINLEEVKVYAVIEKLGEIYRVRYMYDIYGKDFADSLVMSNMILLLFLAVIGSLIMFNFSNRLVNRIVKLRGKVKSISEGFWDNPIQVDKNDELGDLELSFDHMREQLIAQDHYRNEMFQNISHELKTPIMVINTYAQGVKDSIYPEGDLSKTIDVILDESNKLDNKVQKILYLNKLQFLKNKADVLTSVKMASIIEEQIIRFQNIRKIDFEIDFKVDAEFIGEAEKWKVALENILSNNLRYANSKIKIELEHNKLTITNDGAEIEFENPNDVFMVFKKGKTGHNGIGLEITKSIVELYGYRISAKNSTEGVVFIIEK